jgi:hypothetical protein
MNESGAGIVTYRRYTSALSVVLDNCPEASSKHCMAVLKNATNKPSNKSPAHPWLKGKNVRKGATVCTVAYPSFVTPESHRSHGRLFNKSSAPVQFQESYVGMVDGYDSE